MNWRAYKCIFDEFHVELEKNPEKIRPQDVRLPNDGSSINLEGKVVEGNVYGINSRVNGGNLKNMHIKGDVHFYGLSFDDLDMEGTIIEGSLNMTDAKGVKFKCPPKSVRNHLIMEDAMIVDCSLAGKLWQISVLEGDVFLNRSYMDKVLEIYCENESEVYLLNQEREYQQIDVSNRKGITDVSGLNVGGFSLHLGGKTLDMSKGAIHHLLLNYLDVETLNLEGTTIRSIKQGEEQEELLEHYNKYPEQYKGTKVIIDSKTQLPDNFDKQFFKPPKYVYH